MGFWLKIIVFLCFTGSVITLVGQKSALDNKSMKKLEEAKKLLRSGKQDESLKILTDLSVKYSCHPEIQLRRASIMHSKTQTLSAIEIYEKILKCGVKVPDKIMLDLSRMYAEVKNYHKAFFYFDRYVRTLPKVDGDLYNYGQTIRFRRDAVNNPVKFLPVKLNENINSHWNEFLPVISADGNTLLFTRRENVRENIMISSLINGDWCPPKILLISNTSGVEAATALDAEGNILFVTACYRKEGLGSCDLYYSINNNGQFSALKNMGRDINSPVWDGHATISADGRLLIFSSNRVGTIGMKDLWYSTLSADQKWSEPINMGAVVNTAYDEDAPFLHQDGRTLYFRSNGHQGMGSYDLFVSRYDDETGAWSTPQNLGYPINDENDQGSLIVALDGKTAYYATDAFTSSPKNLDIIQFELPLESRARAMCYTRLSFYDKKQLQPITVRATLSKLGSSKQFSKLVDRGRSWLICMEKDEEYALFVEADGYLPFSINFSLEEEYPIYEPIEKKIFLEKIPEKGLDAVINTEPVILENIFFESGSADLLGKSLFEIEKVAVFLKAHLELKVKIIGHTDNVGTRDSNLKLSKDRAESVKRALEENGISSQRILTEGKGEESSIADNSTPEGRSKNRRTEIIFFLD